MSAYAPRDAPAPPIPPAVRHYADSIAHAAVGAGAPLASIIVFGSVVTGGYAGSASDVDLILVLEDGADPDARSALRARVDAIEIEHGFRDANDRPVNPLDAFARAITANVRSFFICSRSDLLSGDVARLLGIPRAQSVFVDRAVLPSIVRSAATVWGSDLLPGVPLRPIRRLDVLKALFGFCNQLLLSAALYPLVPAATKYAMGALKRSIHNCYFCYHLRPASLDIEVEFFRRRLGPDRTLDALLSLRREYRRSFGFIMGALPLLLRLHMRTLADNPFPRLPHSTIDAQSRPGLS